MLASSLSQPGGAPPMPAAGQGADCHPKCSWTCGAPPMPAAVQGADCHPKCSW